MKQIFEPKRHLLQRAALISLLAVALAALGCSENEEPEEEEPIACETSEECAEDEVCEEEICVEGEDEIPIEAEDYLVSFRGRTSSAFENRNATVRVLGSRDGTDEDLLTEGIDCVEAQACGVTRNFEHFIEVRETEEAGVYDLYSAPINADTMSIEGSPALFSEGVQSPRLRGDGVIYRRLENGRYMGYYQAPGSDELLVAGLADEGSSPGRGWDADPTADRAIVFIPTLESQDIRLGAMSSEIDNSDLVYTFGRDNLPGEAGSLYSTQAPTGFSEDGRYVAISTRGPNAHNSCVTNDDCSGTSQICGSEDRCVALERTAHIFDMENIETLGNPCTDHDTCGPVHRCDSGAEDFDGGQCAPQRVIIGIPAGLSQGTPSQTGCEATRADGSYSYTDIVAPMTFGPDGTLYMTVKRDCVKGQAGGDDTEANIPKTAIIAADVETGEFEELFGNLDGEDFSDARCYDTVENQIDVEDCVVMIENARISPDGNDLVYLATNPNVTSANLAARVFDIWRVRRDGEDHEWLGETPQSFRINHFQVHSDPR